MSTEATGPFDISSIAPLVGEFTWHSVTYDPGILEVSEKHYREILDCVGLLAGHKPLKILEIGAYAHVTGYLLAKRQNEAVDLFDISASNLRLGQQIAAKNGVDSELVRRTAGDFHQLPYESGSFDLVFIYAALHHTKRYEDLLREMLRVVAPGGILFVGQEPLRRAACLYGFEVNRPELLTAFETRLKELDLLRIVGEPYPCSRPEKLFGMVENQEMDLDSIHQILSDSGEVLKFDCPTDVSMGEIEKAWLKLAQAATESCDLASRLSEDLLARIRQARTFEDRVSRGLNFRLPDDSEIRSFCDSLAPRLLRLNKLKGHELQLEMARVFGGTLTAVTRRGPASVPASGHSRRPLIQKTIDGITYACPENMRFFMVERNSIWPDVQTSTFADFRAWFDEEEWGLYSTDVGVKYLCMVKDRSRIRVPKEHNGKPRLILIRANVDPGEHPFRFTIRSKLGLHCEFGAFRNDPFLVSFLLDSPEEVTLEVMRESYEKAPPYGPWNTSFSYVGAFTLD